MTQDSHHVAFSKMDEFEMNYIFNELVVNSMVSQMDKNIKAHTSAHVYQEYYRSRLCILYAKKNVTQDTYYETISKMDEFEMNYIFNELDTVLELIHANCIVRNVRHSLISTTVKTLILKNEYEHFFIRTE